MAGGGDWAERGWLRLAGRLDTNALEQFRALAPEAGPGRRLSVDAVPDLLEGWNSELAAMGFDHQPRRAVFFHKSSEVNWSLPWHQDRVVTETGTLRPREAPLQTLRRMAFAYVALDDVAAGGGGLQLAEGSHRFGMVRNKGVDRVLATTRVVRPELRAGEALLVHMLTLHRSAVSETGARRRSVRLDFGQIEARCAAF